MITIYYAGDTMPEKRTCEIFGYPNRDNTGATQYENTHFKDIESAWHKVITEAEAGVSLGVRAVRNKHQELREAELKLVNLTIDLETAKENLQSFNLGRLVI